MFRLHIVVLGLVVFAGPGCARDVIPNTDVDDTAENREVIDFVERYRLAVEARDVARMLSMASERYYDDNGTPNGLDDLDLSTLREKLSAWSEQVLDVRYEIRYRRISYERDRILVDYTYTGSFRVGTTEGDRWSRRLADNRLVLVREDEAFRIVSGM